MCGTFGDVFEITNRVMLLLHLFKSYKTLSFKFQVLLFYTVYRRDTTVLLLLLLLLLLLKYAA